jgi:glycosyltransferase involved in cell wall biosynthesis
MKVLFISSGNSKSGISPIIKNQGESLKKQNIHLEYFTIKGKGINGYLNSILSLRKKLKKNSYAIVHAHYSLSAFIASLAGAKPLIVSLMGSDVKANNLFKSIIYIFNYLSWSNIIVKSKDMYLDLNIKNAHIIPNGINMNKFKPISQDLAQRKLDWDSRKRHILFASNPNRPEKNFELAKKAFDIIDDENLELHYLEDIPNEIMPYYFNASDVILLTSLWEGSPNVIKEAMSCNRPIVSTNVGDVKNIIKNVEGCYLVDYDKYEVSKYIQKSLAYKETNGRENISYLNENNIAKELIKIYNKIRYKRK